MSSAWALDASAAATKAKIPHGTKKLLLIAQVDIPAVVCTRMILPVFAFMVWADYNSPRFELRRPARYFRRGTSQSDWIEVG